MFLAMGVAIAFIVLFFVIVIGSIFFDYENHYEGVDGRIHRKKEPISYEEINGKIYKVEEAGIGKDRKTLAEDRKEVPKLQENEQLIFSSIGGQRNSTFITDRRFYLKRRGRNSLKNSDGIIEFPYEDVYSFRHQFKRITGKRVEPGKPGQEQRNKIHLYKDGRQISVNNTGKELPDNLKNEIRERRAQALSSKETPDLKEELHSAVKDSVKIGDDYVSPRRDFIPTAEKVLQDSYCRCLKSARSVAKLHLRNCNPLFLFDHWLVGIATSSQPQSFRLFLLYRPNIYFTYFRKNLKKECHRSVSRECMGGGEGGPHSCSRSRTCFRREHMSCTSEETSNKLRLCIFQALGGADRDNLNQIRYAHQSWTIRNVDYNRIKSLLYHPNSPKPKL